MIKQSKARWRIDVRHAVRGRVLLWGMVLLAGCHGGAHLPRNKLAYEAIPAAPGEPTSDYVLGPSDVISLSVLNEPDLTLKDVQVSSGGNISVPLIGQVKATGLTTAGLADEVRRRLAVDMLIRPDVTVNLTTAVSQKVTVEGSVTKPGIFHLEGRTTLLGAIAMAEGSTRVAALDQVVILRTIDGRQAAAVFDISLIRRGRMPDPEILAGDTVTVGFSNVKGAWRDILAAAPMVAAFWRYR